MLKNHPFPANDSSSIPLRRSGAVDGLRFFLEAPSGDRLPSRFLEVRGWAFLAGGGKLDAVRLVLPGWICPGIGGLERPDVRAAFPGEAPPLETGFQVKCLVPGGKTRIRLEGRRGDGTWVGLFEKTYVAPRWRLLNALTGSSNLPLLRELYEICPQHAPRPLPPGPSFVDARPDLPGFAIVVPSYQQARFLQENLESVLGQEGVRVDVAVMDGGSDDGSVEIIRNYAERLTHWTSGPDSGQSAAVADGFGRLGPSGGEIMAWLNSDDFYLPGALSWVADYFARHPEVDVIYGHRILVDESSMEIGRWRLPAHDPEILRLNDFIPQETMFWRRRIWEKAGGIDPAYTFAFDWDLLLRFQAAGAEIRRVPQHLAAFRVHPGQKSQAQMNETGQSEIDRLRARTYGKALTPDEILSHPRLRRFLIRSLLTKRGKP